MPFTVKISPSVIAGTQAAIVPDVSLKNAGLMTPALLALVLGGSGGTPFAFTFDPLATPSGNVYNDWNALMAAMALVSGAKQIYFVGDCTIPAGGPYDMTGVQWMTSTSATVHITDGATFTKLRYVGDGIGIDCPCNTPPVADFSADPGKPDAFFFGFACNVRASMAAPFIFNNMNNGGFLLIFCDTGNTFSGSGTPCVGMTAGGAITAFIGGTAVTVETGAISGPADALLAYFITSSSDIYSRDQPAFTGFIFTVIGTIMRSAPTSIQAGPVSYTANPGETVRADPSAGTVTVQLPSASLNPGAIVYAKNQTASVANPVTVTPTGGDTIDGGASLSFSISRGCVAFESDGVSDWMAISKYS